MPSKLDIGLKWVSVIVQVGLLALVAATILTMWVIGQSRERTNCYKTAATVAACSQPGAIERALRTLIGPKAING